MGDERPPGAAALAVAMLLAVLAVIGCGAGPQEPPPVVAREDPAQHLRRISARWSEELNDVELLSGDPGPIASYRARARRVLELLEGGRTRETFLREEVVGLRTGRELACTVQGAVEGNAQYAWHGNEVRVLVTHPAARLPRTCRAPGHPEPHVALPARATRYALRNERLLAIEPALDRSVLLPAP